MSTFEELLAEGESVPVAGWDFSWFGGRATEQRPSWGYSRLLGARMAAADVALDIQTGGGEVLEGIPYPPRMLVATESWPPNLAIAQRRLRRLGARVVQAADGACLPFAGGTFDLVVSRHPVITVWHEIARVLRPGGIYLSQQVGAGSNRELSDFLMGPQPPSAMRDPDRSAADAEAAGLNVLDLRRAELRVTFNDIAAVVVFLRKVIWTVPDFNVERYRDRLAELHERIQAEGAFVAHAQRFLIEARRSAQRRTANSPSSDQPS
ncbi:MAG: class I SAM-dependent methyltransferase [Micromonosporaceae bacterium]|nr:class I SAM-dependent methyltransferase [Micromonosporaceae bacterium]